MQKQDADKLKQEYKQAEDFLDANALDHFSAKAFEEFLVQLDVIEDVFRKRVPNYTLTLTQDILDPEYPQVVRLFWFGRGQNAYYLGVSGSGLMRYRDPTMPKRSYDQIHNVLNTLMGN